MDYKGEGVTNCNWDTRNNPQSLGKGTKEIENKRTTGNHQYFRIIKIGQNTEKSPGELKRFAVTQTPLRHHQLTLA